MVLQIVIYDCRMKLNGIGCDGIAICQWFS